MFQDTVNCNFDFSFLVALERHCSSFMALGHLLSIRMGLGCFVLVAHLELACWNFGGLRFL